jgi:hypothetical protein
MRSSKNPPEDDRSVQSLKVSLEIIANLIYLSRRTETHCAQQHLYLDRATKVMSEIANRPRFIGKIIQVVPLSEVTKPMGCEEKARLVEEYSAATSAFSEAVKELRRKIGTSPREEYTRLERISSQARVKAEQARLALEQHISSHRC